MVSLQLIKLDNHYYLLDNGIPTRYYYDDFVKNIRNTNGATYSKSDHIFPIIASTKTLGGQIPTPNIDFGQIDSFLGKTDFKNNEGKMFTKEDMVDFACRVYDENYKKDMSFKKKAQTMVETYNSCEIEPLKKYYAEIEMEWKPKGEGCKECGTGFKYLQECNGCDNICNFHTPKVNEKGFINILNITAR